MAERILTDNSPKIAKLSEQLEGGERRDFPDEMMAPVQKEFDRLRASIAASKEAQRAFIKSFLILVWLVIDSLTVDQLINLELQQSVTALTGAYVGRPLLIIDVVVSAALLTWAGENLWKGAWAIGKFFDVSFENEKQDVERLRALLRSMAAKGVGERKSSR